MKTRKIATKLTARIVDFARKKVGVDYMIDENNYFHYPNYFDYKGFKKGFHGCEKIEEGYDELTEQEFINYFNENETMKTKFIDVSGTSKPKKKETVFTHGQIGTGEFVETKRKLTEFKEVYYLGEFFLFGSLFKAVDKYGDALLFKGIKGDEFNS